MVQNIGKSQTIRIIVVRKFHRLLNIANIIITISHVLYVLHLNNTVCSKTKVTEISALLFCKVFIASKCLFILYNSLAYCIWVLDTDEIHIHLNGYINLQTTSFLGFERPDVVQKPLHSARVTIWYAIFRPGILGPYFIEGDAQNPLTVNQECYREIIIAPFVQDLKHFFHTRNLPLWRQWMQQDGTTAHTASESLACLQQHFGDCFISHGAEFPFPSHSPDLTAPDAYTRGMLKESVFWSDDPPGNVHELREKIQSFFVSLQQPVFISMSNNLKDRYEQCARHEGTHFEQMLYRCI